MQPAKWYVDRLRAMSASEVAWRVGAVIRDARDRVLLPLRRRPLPLSAFLSDGRREIGPGFRVTTMEPGAWAALEPGDPREAWRLRLLAKADRIACHEVGIFDLEDAPLGGAIDWNRNPKTGTRAPMRFGPWIDYRDFTVAGDPKFIWELNRHHHLVVLGRAWRASGERLYAAAIAEQLGTWLEQCPAGAGINWRSPLEMAIRLVSWVFAIDLVRESGAVDEALIARLVQAAFLQLREITRKYSRASSANNHLIGEAAGVYVAASYFSDLRNAAAWRAESAAILEEQILAQTHPDGGSREQALGYHLFVLELLLVAGIVARKRGEDFSRAYWARLAKMLGFAAALAEGGRELPMFGDCDEGRALDLGAPAADARALLSTGAVLFGRADWKACAGDYAEPTFWLLGPSSREWFDAIPAPPVEAERLRSASFPDSGLYLLQSGHRDGEDRLSVTFDCGELGFGSLAAHGHADALSFTVRAFGVDLLVDPGTYDYFSFPAWREYFRSTRAHNAVVIDGLDQSEMKGPFLWGTRARARCIRCEEVAGVSVVEGEHDGYLRLADPVVHRRTLELDGARRVLTIRDVISARGPHEVTVCFHFGERCALLGPPGSRVKIRTGEGRAVLLLDPRLRVRTLAGSEEPIGGWTSRGYHRKTASTTLAGSCASEGEITLTSRIAFGRPRRRDTQVRVGEGNAAVPLREGSP